MSSISGHRPCRQTVYSASNEHLAPAANPSPLPVLPLPNRTLAVPFAGLRAPSPTLRAVPERTWTYVPFANTIASDTSSVGLGISPVRGSDRLVVYLTGGEVGDRAEACAERGGFDAQDLARSWVAQGHGLFNRDDLGNPLRDASFVAIPAVNHDRHMGRHWASYGLPHWGQANLDVFLAGIAPVFSHVKHLVVAGTSAGAFGAAYNFPRIAGAFPQTDSVLICDSGPFLAAPYEALGEAKVREWGLRETVAAGWERLIPNSGDSTSGSGHWYELMAATYPTTPVLIVGSVFDACISQSYGLSLGEFGTAMLRLPAHAAANNGQVRTFLVNDTRHGWLRGSLESPETAGTLSSVCAGGKRLSDAIADLLL